jgi:hypothetical protein
MIEHGAVSRASLAAIAASAAVVCAGALTAPASARTVSVNCRGGGSFCNAIVGVAGGASDEKLRIALTDTNLKLVGVVAKPAEIRGAYLLTRGSYSLGGSLYTVTLNAVRGIPKGSTLTLRFASNGRAIKT